MTMRIEAADKSRHRTNQLALLVPVPRLLIYWAACTLFVYFSINAGCSFGVARLSASDSARFGYLLFLSHLAVLVPSEVFYALGAQTGLWFKPKLLLQVSRSLKWSAASIYGVFAVVCSIAGFGLGLALSHSRCELAYVFGAILLGWHLLVRRFFCETKCTPHMLQRPEFSPWEKRIEWVSDVPFMLVCLAMFAVTKYPIWVFAAVLVLSYSIVVRFGHWYRDAGPITYLSSLAGLLLGGFLLWPFSKVPDVSGVLAAYTGANAIRVDLTLRERAIYIVSTIGFGAHWAVAFFFNAEHNFSEATLFGPLSFSLTTILNLITVFLIPLLGYFFAYDIAEKRRFLRKHKPLV